MNKQAQPPTPALPPARLTDEQWAEVAHILNEPLRYFGPGRPRAHPRIVLDGVLWKLRTCRPWFHMPRRLPSRHTCQRRYQAWSESGVLRRALAALAEDLVLRGGVDLSTSFMDGIMVLHRREGIWKLKIASRFQGTWQHNTAMLFLRLALEEAE